MRKYILLFFALLLLYFAAPNFASASTFGYTTIGGTELSDTNAANVKVASMVSQLTASTGDTLTSYSIYGRNSDSSGTMLMTAYTVVSSEPSARLAVGTSITVTNSVGWFTSSGVSQALTNGTVYSVAVGFGSLGADTFDIFYDAGSAPGRFNSTAIALGDPFSVSGTDSGRHYSWYATYTAATAGDKTGNIIIWYD